MKKKSSSFYNLSLGKCKPWFKGAKDLGQSRLSGESDGDVSEQFNNVCQALGETRVGRGVPLRARRLVLNRVSLCLFFFFWMESVCSVSRLYDTVIQLPLNRSLVKMSKTRNPSRLKKEREIGKYGLVSWNFNHSPCSPHQLRKCL